MQRTFAQPVCQAIGVIENLHAGLGLRPITTFADRLKWRPSALETISFVERLSALGAHGAVLNAAMRHRRRVGCFSTAASARRFALHLLLNWSGVPSERACEGFLCEMDFPMLTQAASQLAGAPIRLDDTPDAGAWRIVTQAERWHADGGLDVVMVDYFNRAAGPMAPELALFKEFSRRTGVPVQLFHETPAAE